MPNFSKYTKKLLERIREEIPQTFNRLATEVAVRREKGRRPHPYSLWSGMGGERATPPRRQVSDYVSWPGLTDRSYTGRHLPPADRAYAESLPEIGELVRTLHLRRGEMVPCRKTSALFCFFAQWFTDSFLRTDPSDTRRNTSNHEIDYCQLYGLDERTTWALREQQGGRMLLEGREHDLLPKIAENGLIRERFADISYLRPRAGEPFGERFVGGMKERLTGYGITDWPERWANMYATGLDRGNSTILYTALSTMSAREHNRIAGVLARAHPDWDDDRLFETARIVNIHNLLEIVIEDYINHLAGEFDFELDPDWAEGRPWYRTNRITIEFDLLYRWHSLVPETLEVEGRPIPHLAYRFNNSLVEDLGPERLINAAGGQRAGRIQLYNTPHFLADAEAAAIKFGREFQLMPFVEYCKRFSEAVPQSFEELVGHGLPEDARARAVADLERFYGSVDRVELPVGLLAQGRDKGNEDAVLPPLVRTMVAVDAFTHILTNPLLAGAVHRAAFSDPEVAALVRDTGGLTGMMARNSRPDGPVAKPTLEVA